MGIIIFLFVLALFVALTFFTVKQQTRAILERFGRYVRTAKPGLNMKMPFIDHVVMRVSLRVQQLIIEVETKTLDNVFVKAIVQRSASS